jgi:uncharacterized membrane protein
LIHFREERGDKLKETARIETFSDGVFSIAITLLIIEMIQILHTKNDESFLKLLFHHWESLFAFFIGFLTIFVCWINHHLVFTYIHKVDGKLMWVNAFVLLMVTFTPFPTAVLAEYFEKEKNLAMAFFGLNFFLMSIAAYCLSAYTYNKKLIKDESRKLFYGFIALYRYSIIYNFAVFIVCFISVPAAIFLYCIMFVVFAFPEEFSKRLLSRKKKK